MPLKSLQSALAHVAQLVGHWPENQKAADWIPRQGTCLGCGPGPTQLGVCKRQLIKELISMTHGREL